MSPAIKASFGSLYSENLTNSNFLSLPALYLSIISSQTSLCSPQTPTLITSLPSSGSVLVASSVFALFSAGCLVSLLFAPH